MQYGSNISLPPNTTRVSWGPLVGNIHVQLTVIVTIPYLPKLVAQLPPLQPSDFSQRRDLVLFHPLRRRWIIQEVRSAI